jgi:glycosyltransferase involved in cell wall biosynthesis
MRVVHIESGRHLYGGGAQVRYLVEGLRAARIDNVLICARGGELAATGPDCRVIDLPMRGDLDLALVRRLHRVLRDVAPDLVHVHSRRGAELYGAAAARLANVPAVLTRRVDAAGPAWLTRLACRPFRVVVALSSAIATQLAERGVEPNRVVRIASAVDAARYRPDPGARLRLLAELGLPPDAVLVGVVAQLIARKGHRLLLGELPAIVRRQPLVHVVLFGRGPLEPELRATVARLGLGRHVVLAGFRADLPALLPGLDVLVHPALREGLGLALLEAASSAVPVVACAAGGVVDAVEDGRTGLLVGVGDGAALRAAIERLVAAPDERARLGAAARERVERRFSVAAMVAAHVSLYSRVLGAAADAPRSSALGPRTAA